MNENLININSLIRELFVILSNLSQIESNDRALVIFIQSVNNLFKNQSISFDTDNSRKDEQFHLEISTKNRNYGSLFFDKPNHSHKEEIEIISFALPILASILERNELRNIKPIPSKKQDQVNVGIKNQKNIESNILNTLSDISPDIFLQLDSEYKCIYHNNNFSSLMKLKHGSYIGKKFLDLNLYDGIKIQLTNEIKSAVKNNKRKIKTIPIDQIHKTFEFLLIPEKGNDENILSVLIIGKDITEKLKLKKELFESHERAEKADRLKLSFLANISHEIRTPLNGIIGFSRLITNKDISETKKDNFIKIIESSNDALLRTLSNIIEISKIESDEFQLFYEEINLHNFIKSFFNDYNNKLKKGIQSRIKFKLDTSSEKQNVIITDHYRLMEVLFNLTDNAFKFTNEGFVQIGYFYKKNVVIFYVKDSGIGIKKEDFEPIFEQFYQVDYSERKEYGGLGLGLTLSKAFIEKMGGKIWIESRYKKGTTIYFNLPVKGNVVKKSEPKKNKNGSVKITIQENIDR